MFRNPTWLTLGVCVCLFAAPARAEPLKSLEDRALGPAVAQIAARAELEKRMGVSLKVRWDPATGTPASVRFQPNVRLPKGEFDLAKDVARVLLNRLARLYGIRKLGAPKAYGVELVWLGTKHPGPWTVVRFEQRVGGVRVDGSQVKVVLSGEGLGVSVSGRLYRDLPTGLGSPPDRFQYRLPAGFRAPLRVSFHATGRRGLQVLITPRSGRWGYAFERKLVDQKRSRTWRVISDMKGTVLSREPWGSQAYSLHGKVFPDGPRDARKLVRLPDISLQGRGRSQLVGAGLAGKYEKVLQRAGSHRIARRGDRVVLDYPLRDARSTEVNLYYQLARSRRWLDRYRDLLGGAHRLPVTAEIRLDENNAFAERDYLIPHGRVGRQKLSFGQVAGVSLARDASVVIHERAHLLLHALGFAGGAGEAGGMHEGYADYISAIVRGNPRVVGSVPVVSRDLSQRKVWPQDGGDRHRTGWIYGGALWDARSEVGAKKMDRVALAAVPLLSGTLLEGRDATLEADRRLYGGRHAEAITRHFKNHGIVEGGGEPPVVRVLAEEGLGLSPGQKRIVEFVAEDPDGKNVTLAVSDLSVARIVGKPTRGKRASLRLELAYDPAYSGKNQINVTATDGDGEVGGRTISVYMLAVEEHLAQVTYRVGVGETKRVPLSDLIPEPQRAAYAGGSFWLAGDVGAGVHLSRGKLVIQPGKRDGGRHEFTLRGAPPGERQVVDPFQVKVKVLVGEGPEVLVRRTTGKNELIPQGRDLEVYAGSSLEVDVSAVAQVGQARHGVQVSTGVRQVSLEVVDRPRDVTYKPGIHSPELVEGRLWIRARARSRPHTFTITLRARFARRGVTATESTRILRVHVLPAVNLPPELWLKRPARAYFDGRLLLVGGKGELELDTRDSEGGQVEVQVDGNRRNLKVDVVSRQAGPAPGPLARRRSAQRIGGAVSRSRRMQGKLVFTWLKRAELPEPELTPKWRYMTTVVVRALDAEGASTLHVVRVFALPPKKELLTSKEVEPMRSRRPVVAKRRGVTDVLDRALGR